jgi:hypothetical protein
MARWTLKRQKFTMLYSAVLLDRDQVIYSGKKYRRKSDAYKSIVVFKRLVQEAGLDDSWGEIRDSG